MITVCVLVESDAAQGFPISGATLLPVREGVGDMMRRRLVLVVAAAAVWDAGQLAVQH